MEGNQFARFWLTIAFCILATGVLTAQSPTGADQHETASTCYPLDQIISALRKSVGRSKTASFESALITTIKRRTVCSRPTASELGKIGNAGGTDKLIDAIESVAPAPPQFLEPAPPCPQPELPTPHQGQLTVSCAPVDCRVFANGASIGVTTNNVISQTISEGPIIVSVGAKDYEPDRNQEIVDIKFGEPKLINFKLKASRAALAITGSKLFNQMITALGGEEGLKAAELVRGKGTITSYRDGKPTLWETKALIQMPDKGRFSVGVIESDGRHSYEIVRTEGEIALIKPGKGSEPADLNLALHQLQEYQLPETVKRLQSPALRIVATELGPTKGEETVLRAEGGSERYLIRLDANFRPEEIFLESGGLDKGTRLLYSDYMQQGSAIYPKRMQVQRPDPTSGIEVQFDTVELNPSDVKDTDFVVKKGKR
jgi:hypothetical protein